MEENKILENTLNYKAKKCLQCGAETDEKDEKELFCSQCGAPVVNRCSDYHCDHLLKESAKYCKYCGSPSIFTNYGLFDNTAPKFSDSTDELPF